MAATEGVTAATAGVLAAGAVSVAAVLLPAMVAAAAGFLTAVAVSAGFLTAGVVSAGFLTVVAPAGVAAAAPGALRGAAAVVLPVVLPQAPALVRGEEGREVEEAPRPRRRTHSGS